MGWPTATSIARRPLPSAYRLSPTAYRLSPMGPSCSPEHVLDAIEQVAFVLRLGMRARLEFFLGQRFRELFEDLALFLVQFFRRLHLYGREHVALAAAV